MTLNEKDVGLTMKEPQIKVIAQTFNARLERKKATHGLRMLFCHMSTLLSGIQYPNEASRLHYSKHGNFPKSSYSKSQKMKNDF